MRNETEGKNKHTQCNQELAAIVGMDNNSIEKRERKSVNGEMIIIGGVK
ncbi:10487_t:CDS:2 [Ambispora gerdemannii]|uniref:10487_t:CDS:1 n=1 Tax=Ambispora gerdemannii TaxID=144530 RepID=A0A9N9AK60_9GLOM|nr:10487_t:CDS:2 [Ambispora gerdemannii]